jgi:hypothetical protein
MEKELPRFCVKEICGARKYSFIDRKYRDKQNSYNHGESLISWLLSEESDFPLISPSKLAWWKKAQLATIQ